MWLPIETAPQKSKRMFVVKAFNQKTSTGHSHNSDPYCVWRNDDGSFARWPHDFKPTHWLPLPED